MKLVVATCLWPGDRGYEPEAVNLLARGVKRHLSIEHRFVCMTHGFSPADFSSDVMTFETPAPARTLAALDTPEGPGFPSSYARLWWLSSHAGMFGDWILMLDADCVIVGELDPLIVTDRGPFVAWRPASKWGRARRIAGGTWLAEAGAHHGIYRRFVTDPFGEIEAARAEGWRGSDQALLSRWFREAWAWPEPHGIYQAQDFVRRFPGNGRHLPADARIVHFNGHTKPWDASPTKMPWLREHWR